MAKANYDREFVNEVCDYYKKCATNLAQTRKKFDLPRYALLRILRDEGIEPKVNKGINLFFKFLDLEMVEDFEKEIGIYKKLAKKYPNISFWRQISRPIEDLSSLAYFFTRSGSQFLERRWDAFLHETKREENTIDIPIGKQYNMDFGLKNNLKPRTLHEFLRSEK